LDKEALPLFFDECLNGKFKNCLLVLSKIRFHAYFVLLRMAVNDFLRWKLALDVKLGFWARSVMTEKLTRSLFFSQQNRVFNSSWNRWIRVAL